MKKLTSALNLTLIASLVSPVVLSATTIKQTTEQVNPDSTIIDQNSLVKKFDLKTDSQYFFDFINWLNQQTNPIVMLNWSASLPYEQEMFIAMVNLFNKAPNLLTIFQEEKSRINPRYDLDKLTAENIVNVLNPDINKPAEIINQPNQQKINVLFDQWDSNISAKQDQIKRDHFGPVLDYFSKQQQNQKINIVMNDMFFVELFRDFQPQINDPLIQILRYANSVLLVSDGAGHIVRAVEETLRPFVLSSEFAKQSRETIEKNLQIVQTGNAQDIAQLSKNDIYNFFLLDKAFGDKQEFDFIHFLHYDTSYKNSLFTDTVDEQGNHIELIPEENRWKVSSVSLNAWDYANLLQNQSQRNINDFMQLLDKAFFVDVAKEEDLFVNLNQDPNDPWAFDPKKKNAIFIGSSLFSPIKELGHKVTSLEQFVNLREYVQASFEQFFKQYPLEEYNILFKHHPIYNAENAIELTKIYTNNQIENPNILKPNIPFEYLLSSEFAKAKANKENLFFTNVNGQIEPKFKLFGLQATTSVIQTTRVFLEASVNLDQEQISQLISFEDFPVPTLFDVVVKPTSDQKKFDKYETNKAKIENAYKFFNPTQWTTKEDVIQQEDRFLYTNIQPLAGKPNPVNDPMVNFLFVMLVLLGLVNLVGLPTGLYLVVKKHKSQTKKLLFFED